MTRTTVHLYELRGALERVLEDLMASDLERRPFVIVQDVVTGGYVQFARRYHPKTGELLFDVPLLRLYLEPCSGPAAGAALAIDVLAKRFDLPLQAELVITVDGDPES